ncbi:MAG TPA: hypothetical protein PKI44_06955 [Candidatus Omnitrophota bacterium]|nr:hypothetical protein [Candidatus Omnitrophota bacterium]
MDIKDNSQNRLTYSSIGRGPVFFSPDDQNILYHTKCFFNDPFYQELKVVNVQGAKDTTLMKGWGIFRLARFSSDSQKVFFVHKGDLYTMDIYKSTLARLTHFNIRDIDFPNKEEGLLFVDNFALSPSGDKIVLAVKEKNALQFIFYSMNTDGSDIKQINRLDNPDQRGYLGYITEMKYSPDGEKVVFIGHFKARPLYLLDENGDLNLIRNLTEAGSRIENIEDDRFVFTPDSKQILLVAAFSYRLTDNFFVWVKSIGYGVLNNLKYFLTRRISGPYDNKYLCIINIRTGDLKRIVRFPVASNFGRDFIHWEK